MAVADFGDLARDAIDQLSLVVQRLNNDVIGADPVNADRLKSAWGRYKIAEAAATKLVLAASDHLGVVYPGDPLTFPLLDTELQNVGIRGAPSPIIDTFDQAKIDAQALADAVVAWAGQTDELVAGQWKARNIPAAEISGIIAAATTLRNTLTGFA